MGCTGAPLGPPDGRGIRHGHFATGLHDWGRSLSFWGTCLKGIPVRSFAVLVCVAAPWAAVAQQAPPSGLGLLQNGAAVALEDAGGIFVAHLSPGPFIITFRGTPDGTHDGPSDGKVPAPLAITFGGDGLFDMMDLPPQTGLFGPASSYARYEGPDAAHYMADPACASDGFGPGFNLLDASHAVPEGYPVAALQTDSASRTCTVEGRLPTDTDLLGLVNPIHAVIRTGDRDTRLILRFVGS